MGYLENIIQNILISIYRMLGASLLATFLFMFLYMYAKEHGWKKSIQMWLDKFKKEKQFRSVFFLTLYTALILFKTIFLRKIWVNPVADILGGWGIYDSKGVLATEPIENVILFIPFSIMLLIVLESKLLKGKGMLKYIKIALMVSFATSMGIETLQLLMKLGTFQISDLVYNTLGGLAGGIIYAIYAKLVRKR